MSIKTDAQLKAELDSTFYTNGANLSTGANTNTHLTNSIDSKVSMIDTETIGGTKTFTLFPYSVAAAPINDYQFANKKYVDDKITQFQTVTKYISAANVNTLGTKFELLPAQGADVIIQIIGIDYEIITATTLEVGSQTLELGFSSGSTSFASVTNSELESSAGTNYYQLSQKQNADKSGNDSFGCILSGAANPSSGDAQMYFYITYITIDVNHP